MVPMTMRVGAVERAEIMVSSNAKASEVSLNNGCPVTPGRG